MVLAWHEGSGDGTCTSHDINIRSCGTKGLSRVGRIVVGGEVKGIRRRRSTRTRAHERRIVFILWIRHCVVIKYAFRKRDNKQRHIPDIDAETLCLL